ncbi:UPF0598 protein C8orf82 homolog isoform X2 [Palaemon carinicauda]|uniref:UPF0598 protein C8orf82 homolog isoform X2 n=1 Tax=Palaemon carinicauda TaxID=392227 RepID=UPI0035B5E2ED
MLPFMRVCKRCTSYSFYKRQSSNGAAVEYVQGQSPSAKIREYFYYIDHQGMLFLDDARMKNFTSCFKEKKFLQFFFSRLRMNETSRYPEFPFLSPCGRERNFVRCDDLPIVFTHLVQKPSTTSVSDVHLAFGNAGDTMTLPWEPSKLLMEIDTGRVYHPGPEVTGGVGLLFVLTMKWPFILLMVKYSGFEDMRE